MKITFKPASQKKGLFPAAYFVRLCKAKLFETVQRWFLYKGDVCDYYICFCMEYALIVWDIDILM